MNDSVDYLLFKELEKKFGKDITKDPQKDWDLDKEKQFKKDLIDFEKKKYLHSKQEDGGEINNLFLDIACECCNKKIAKNFMDKVYIRKYKVCYDCYIKHNP